MLLPNAYRDERSVTQSLLEQTELDWQAVCALAEPWIEEIRASPPPFWALESLLKAFPIHSQEGLALMRLAEALLRTPDLPTAIELTRDQLGGLNFESAHSAGAMGQLSTRLLLLSKTLLKDVDTHTTLERLVGRWGQEWVVKAAIHAVELMGQQFVFAPTLAQALDKRKAGQLHSFDMLGEGARTRADAERYHSQYMQALRALVETTHADQRAHEKDGVSIKLSALCPRFEAIHRAQVQAQLLPVLIDLCEVAARHNLPLTLDAEESDRLELTLTVFESLMAHCAQAHPDWQGLGLAVQAYQTRALPCIDHLLERAVHHNMRLMVRLVKGAYWDSEIKRAQEMGLAFYPVFTHKHHTDLSYLACAHKLLQAGETVYPQFATHNAGTLAAVLHMAPHGHPGFEIQRLHGMGENLHDVATRSTGIRSRIYAPVGQPTELLAYLVRRLLENGANTSFVHRLADPGVPVEHLLQSPLYVSHDTALPLPRQLFAERENSAGDDMACEEVRMACMRALNSCTYTPPKAGSPTDSAPDWNTLLSKARAAHSEWSHCTLGARAAALEDAADHIESDRFEWAALLVKEARKTWADALSEVREAVDFLRYYAHQARQTLHPVTLPGPTGELNTLHLEARGVWVCISPWNFPLAILIGQVAAALVTGNAVLAKPAPQTTQIAHKAVHRLHASGIPFDALQLITGGAQTGAACVRLPGIAGVAFTGSLKTAKCIQAHLAQAHPALLPLIAETGGINALVADSTALPEHLCDAVVAGAFRSAGQRCSATRLLLVHEAIADRVIDMLSGAAALLVMQSSSDWACDVPPLIDAAAYARLTDQCLALESQGARRIRIDGMADDPDNHRFAPRIYDVSQSPWPQEELFGPVLCVQRWNGPLQPWLDRIHAQGFGLTFGVHSRISGRCLELAQRAGAGNVYINRNTIGAVVGVHPFGGRGLSGTGPKAGGPHYLMGFCQEKTVCVNTVAAGGNVTLLSQNLF